MVTVWHNACAAHRTPKHIKSSPHQPLHMVTAQCYDTQCRQMCPRTTTASAVPFPSPGAISGGPRCPLPWRGGYLGKEWCPQSRKGWWSACCSRWSTAASPGCSSGAPGSTPGSRPWPGRWRRGTPPPHAAGAREHRQHPGSSLGSPPKAHHLCARPAGAGTLAAIVAGDIRGLGASSPPMPGYPPAGEPISASRRCSTRSLRRCRVGTTGWS